MGRRQHQGLASDLIGLPWQVSAILALVSFVGIRWMLPAFLPKTGVLAAIGPTLQPVSWVALGVFSILALLAAMRAVVQRRTVKGHDVRERKQQSLVDASAPGRRPAAQIQAPPAAWSLEALRMLEWKRFELLCARYYEAVGFRTETLGSGPDGGIDVKLFKGDAAKPLAIVQCKAWNARQVGVKEIRELFGVMTFEQITRSIFITTGSYSQDALSFAAANPIHLIDGPAFVRKLLDLPEERRRALLEFAFAGDFHTPTCASCGVKMVARDSRRGAFWGCTHYPRCKTMLPMRDPAAVT